MQIKTAVGYLRAGTREQRRSGLGLAAQRFEIQAFAAREDLAIRSWYQDLQTGAGRDALQLRPGLAMALTEARALRCPLIVSKLDRLSRNVHFIASLMERKVHFMVAALGRDCDQFILHIYASLAEQERKLISERVKAAAAIAKLRGTQFGLALRPKAEQRRVSAMGRAVLVKEAQARAEACRVHIEWAFQQPGLDGGPISYRAAAQRLNDRNVESPTGTRWRGQQLRRMTRRLGLDYPLGYQKHETVRAQVQAIWQGSPDCTVAQVVAHMKTIHRVSVERAGVERAGVHLKQVRLAAARRSSVQRRVGWPVDRWTSTRIQIGGILRRQPTFTGKQVLDLLRPHSHVRLQWVWQVMGEYHQATTKPGAAARRLGRRFYPLWRSGKTLLSIRSAAKRRTGAA